MSRVRSESGISNARKPKGSNEASSINPILFDTPSSQIHDPHLQALITNHRTYSIKTCYSYKGQDILEGVIEHIFIKTTHKATKAPKSLDYEDDDIEHGLHDLAQERKKFYRTKNENTKELVPMHPLRPVCDLSMQDIDDNVSVSSTYCPTGEIAPFYVIAHFLDLQSSPTANRPFGDDETKLFGPYSCLEEANSNARDLVYDLFETYCCGYDGHRQRSVHLDVQYLDHEGINNHAKSDNWIKVTVSDNARSGTPSRFLLVVQSVNKLPSHLDEDDAVKTSMVRQQWDIYIVTCRLGGRLFHVFQAPTHPIIRTKVSIDRESANKYAAKYYLEATKDLLPECNREADLKAIKAIAIDAQIGESILQGREYSWHFEKEFVCVKEHEMIEADKLKARLSGKKVVFTPHRTLIKISVEKFNIEP